MLATTTIARNTLVETLRQPIVLVIVLLSGVFQYFTTAISAYTMSYRNVPGEVTSDDKLLLDIGLATVFLCGIILAAVVSTSAVSREIENKTVLTVISKPVGRAAVVIGKFLGVAGTTTIGVFLMVLFLLFALRHGVMSTAADNNDWPAIIFSVGPILAAVSFAAFTNFLYGWSFPQTATLVMAPLTAFGYLITLFVSDEWQLQNWLTDFKPQIMVCCIALGAGLLVMTSVALAVSTRLGQVMTILICLGVFVGGLMSNALIGRYAFKAEPYARIRLAEPATSTELELPDPGTAYRLTLEKPPEIVLEIGDPVLFGPSPNGLAIATPGSERPDESVDLSRTLFANDVPPALVVTAFDNEELTIKHIGGRPLGIQRNPVPGDYLFAEPATTNIPARAAWSLVPNLQSFWLIDAVTQVQPIPLSHVGLVALYSGVQIAFFLSIAVLLFQGRDVG